MEKIEFFAFLQKTAHERNSLYKGSRQDREKVVDFLEMNGWFGIEVQGKQFGTRERFFVTEEQAVILCAKLGLWLDGFRRGNHEKLDILAQYGAKRLPQTVSRYLEFIRKECLGEDISAWKLLDFLLFHLPGELAEIKPFEAGKLVDTLDQEATRAVSELYAQFYSWMQDKYGIRGWRYKFEYRKKRDEIEAYTVQQFCNMAYFLFNDEWWEEKRLVEKACESSLYANLWAFIAMHFVCGMRSTDIIRIPKPDLRMSGDEFQEKAMTNTVEKPEAISRDMMIRIRYRPERPHKTLAAYGIPDKKVFIPAILEKPMGIILGIAASHHPEIRPGNAFLHADRSISRTRSFFGKEFMDSLGGKGFASSRANKSYLQGLEMMADSSEGNVKGYMIAALARSHKGGLATLPDVTDIYLKDAAFSGYKPEFIAREMFERGIFGFIPHLLLEVYAGKDYKALPIQQQTQMIMKVGIRASGIENIVRICEASLVQAQKTVANVIASKVNVADLIQEIASGRAVGKQEGCLCVMTGGGFPCAFPDRAACIGCRYEIHTKAILHQLSSEYARMCGLAKEPDGWRYEAMLKKVVVPILWEYFLTANESIPEIDMEPMKQIMEGGYLNYAYSGKQDVGDGLQPVPGC